MKKKIIILGVIVCIVVVLTASINLHFNRQSSETIHLIQNVEAFADDSEGNVKVTTCIGKKTECTLSDGTKGWGKPVQVSVDW